MIPGFQLSAVSFQLSAFSFRPLLGEAEFTPIAPAAQLTIVSLLVVVLLVLQILAFFKRKPPLDSELIRLHVAIKGLKEAVGTLNAAQKAHATHATEIEALQQKVRDLEEHREKDLHAQRTYTRETTKEIFDKLDGIKASLSANLQSVENRLGRVDGALELISKHMTGAPFGQ